MYRTNFVLSLDRAFWQQCVFLIPGGKARSKTTLVGLLIVERFGLNKAHGLESCAMLSLRLNTAHGHRIPVFHMYNTDDLPSARSSKWTFSKIFSHQNSVYSNPI
jgi:hypothetical protein